MRWNCPHCGTSLAVPDEKLPPQWSFSRCYKCGGFGLVRRPEPQVIKVDEGPEGDHIHPQVLTEQAKQLIQKTKKKAKQQHAQNRLKTLQNEVPVLANLTFPDPIPVESLDQPMRGKKRITVLAGLFSLLILATGFYYLQKLYGYNPRNTPRQAAVLRRSQPSQNVPTVKDSVTRSAMAPNRENKQRVKSHFFVQVIHKNIEIHSGPGLDYPSLGLAQLQNNYRVIEWNEDWFKVEPVLNSKQKNLPENLQPQIGWVRNDWIITHAEHTSKE